MNPLWIYNARDNKTTTKPSPRKLPVYVSWGMIYKQNKASELIATENYLMGLYFDGIVEKDHNYF